jgi:hypothetical protein
MTPENLNAAIKTGSMADVGTRLQFLTELYDLWKTGLDIEDHKRELESALKLLGFHMMKDYKEPKE